MPGNSKYARIRTTSRERLRFGVSSNILVPSSLFHNWVDCSRKFNTRHSLSVIAQLNYLRQVLILQLPGKQKLVLHEIFSPLLLRIGFTP